MVQTEEKKVYMTEYRKNNKDKIKEQGKEYNKEYRKNNKEKIKEQGKEYRETNSDKIKEYRQTDVGKKGIRISNWKQSGVICDDFDSLYEYYINCKNCENCAVELVDGNKLSNRRCLDHSHKTGLFRNVLCNTCNTKRGE